MELKNFNYMFFVVLIYLSLSVLYGGWSYKQAKEITIDNQDYKHISQEQERLFNEWDLERMYKLHLSIGLFLFLLTMSYLFMCIKHKEVGGNSSHN